MVVDKKVLDDLTTQAKASPRLRMNLDLRNSAEDGSQRPGTQVPIHRPQLRMRRLSCCEDGLG